MNNKILLFIFFVLASVAAWFFATQTSDSFNDADKFAIKKTDKIHRILLANRKGETAELTRKDGKWIYNGKYKARKAAINNLLETVEKMEILYIAPKAAEENVMRDLASNGVVARFFDKNDKKIMGYQIGTSSADGQGTHIIMEDSDQPFVVHIPLWEGHLTPRYLVKEEDWRDRAVFSTEYEDIKSVSIDYPKQQKFSFKIEKKGKTYSVNPLNPTATKMRGLPQQGVIKRYFGHFKRLEAEAIKNSFEQKLEITKQLPFAVVKMVMDNGQEKEVRFFPIAGNHAKEDAPTPGRPVRTEKYFATMDDDFLLVQQVVFGKIFQSYASFFTAE